MNLHRESRTYSKLDKEKQQIENTKLLPEVMEKGNGGIFGKKIYFVISFKNKPKIKKMATF